MKPFLGIDVTNDKKNEQMNLEEFLVFKPSEALSQSMEDYSEDAIDVVFEKTKLPLIARILQWIFGLAGLCITMACARTVLEDDISIKQIYAQLPWLFWLAGASIVIWAVITFFAKRKEKAVMESDESERFFSGMDAIAKSIYDEMGLSGDEKSVDVLSFEYKLKDGECKPYKSALEDMVYNNLEYYIFADDKNLYLADTDGKYAFALSSLRAIHKIKKKIALLSWNKDVDYYKGEYKRFKMHEDDAYNVIVKNYCILELEHNGESWGIYFPEYELETFEELTGLKVE